MKLNEFFRNTRILREGGNLSSHDIYGEPTKGYIAGVEGKHEAEKIDAKNRTIMQPVVKQMLVDINNTFYRNYDRYIWTPELIEKEVETFISGSSKWFMMLRQPNPKFNPKEPVSDTNPKEIGVTNDDFRRVKKKVGDVDTQVDRRLEPQIEEFLHKINGKNIGSATLLGFKKGNDQWLALWKIHEPPINLQVDLEFSDYRTDERGFEIPTEWAQVSHGSQMVDLEKSIKGVFRQWLYRAMAKISPSDKYVARLAGRGKNRKITVFGGDDGIEQVTDFENPPPPVHDANFTFAVASSGGGGAREKYRKVRPEDNIPKKIKDVNVFVELDPKDSKYIQDLSQQFRLFFGTDPTDNEQRMMHSLVGSVELMETHLDKEQQQIAVREFIKLCFGPAGQMIDADDPEADFKTKMPAIDYLLDKFGMQGIRKGALEMAKQYESAYRTKKSVNMAEGWSKKYKRSINCSHPKGFSQKAHCAGKKKHNESAETEMVCPDCGMCKTHGNNMMEIKQRLDANCWKGKHKEGTKIKGGIRVNNCVPNEGLNEAEGKPDYRRVGIKHIYNPGSTVEMPPLQFIDMCQEIANSGGTLDGVQINLKVDGAGIRFGKDQSGQPFMMTSKVDKPLYASDVGSFRAYGVSNGQDPEQLKRTEAYDHALDLITNSQFVKSLPADTIIQAEMLFNEMAEQTPDGMKFVNIAYDPKRLGKAMTLVPIMAKRYSTGEILPNEGKIIDGLIKQSSPQIKIIGNRLQQQGINVKNIVDPIARNAEQLKTIFRPRSKDSAEKQQAQALLAQARQALSDAIIDSPKLKGMDILGPNNEGIVINMPSGILAKVTSTKMKSAMAAKAQQQFGDTKERTAVVATGNFAGHRGHEQLIDLTIAKAKELGGTPFVFVGQKVGPDDPIDLDTKMETLHKLYPGVDIRLVENQTDKATGKETQGSDLKKVEMELVKQPPYYNNILMAVGSDQGKSMTARTEKVTQRFSTFEPLAHVKVGAYVTPRGADEGGTGVSTTELRDALKNLPEEEAFKVWSRAYNVKKLGIDWIKHLMDIARGNLRNKKTTEAKKKKMSSRYLFAGMAVGQMPGDMWKGTDKGPPGTKAFGGGESVEIKAVPLDEHWENQMGQLIENILLKETLPAKRKKKKRRVERENTEITAAPGPATRRGTTSAQAYTQQGYAPQGPQE